MADEAAKPKDPGYWFDFLSKIAAVVAAVSALYLARYDGRLKEAEVRPRLEFRPNFHATKSDFADAKQWADVSFNYEIENTGKVELWIPAIVVKFFRGKFVPDHKVADHGLLRLNTPWETGEGPIKWLQVDCQTFGRPGQEHDSPECPFAGIPGATGMVDVGEKTNWEHFYRLVPTADEVVGVVATIYYSDGKAGSKNIPWPYTDYEFMSDLKTKDKAEKPTQRSKSNH